MTNKSNQQTPFKAYVYYVSAIMLLVAVASVITKWEYTPHLFALGAAGVATYYLITPYEGTNFRLKRLHRFEIIAGIMLLVSSFLLFRNRYSNEWLMTFSIAVFLILYTTIITSIEEKKKE